MLLEANLDDPWTRTINLLSLPAGSQFAFEELFDPAVTRRAPADVSGPAWEPAVRVIDRPSPLSVTLDWRDATKCCYREQLWVAARARVAGRCAMSGEPIAPGDEIFRPRPARPAPRNVNAMILASAIEACAGGLPRSDELRCKICPEALAFMHVREPVLDDAR